MNILKIPIVRHLLAGAMIVASLYFTTIKPLQNTVDKLTTKQTELIAELSKKDTYKIENTVSDVKVKKGGAVKLTPDNDLSVVNVAEDSTKTKKPLGGSVGLVSVKVFT